MAVIGYIVVGVIVAVCLTAVLVPIGFECTVKGAGEFGKTWSAAAAVRIALVTVSAAAAQGVDGIVQVHVLGWRVFRRSPITSSQPAQQITQKPSAEKPSAEKPSTSPLAWLTKRAPRYYERVTRRVRIGDLPETLWGLRRFVRRAKLDGHLRYATPDVAVTGMIAGGLFSLAGLLSPWGTFSVEPLWQDEAKIDSKLHIKMRIYPGRIAVTLLWYVLTHWRWSDRGSDDVSDEDSNEKNHESTKASS